MNRSSGELLPEHFSDRGLYGREAETAALERAFDRIRLPDARSEVALVVGPGGAGKSSLVRELAGRCGAGGGGGGGAGGDDDAAAASASFASGKFDQICRREPYSAVVDAFAELCRGGAVRAESARSSMDVESRRFLCRIIPDSHAAFGTDDRGAAASEQDEGGGGGGGGRAEALNRLKYALRLLVRAASADRPLVLFLDDLQWADETSMEIVASLVTDSESRNVLFVLSIRDNEIEGKHHLTRGLSDMEESYRIMKKEITKVRVGMLDRDSVNSLLSDVLCVDPHDTLPLTEVVHRKTLGNVFFVVQFMILIHEEGLLAYSYETFDWVWDVDKILACTDIADNVVAVVAGRIERLPRAAQVLLKLASCLGSTFHRHVLATITTRGAWDVRGDDCEGYPEASSGGSGGGGGGDDLGGGGDNLGGGGVDLTAVAKTAEEEVASVLDSALREGLLEQVSPTQYKFAHDRIQQAAYSLTSEGRERDLLHYRIGKILWEMSSSPEAGLEWMPFLAADQLNRGAGCMSGAAERFAAAELNLTVAEEAMSTGAFISAAGYLESAVDLLDSENKWGQNYELTLRLCSAAAEAEHCRANFDRSVRMAREVVSNARSLQDELRAYFTLVDCQSSAGQYDEALKTGFEVLAKLGEPIPKKPRLVLLAHHFFKTSRMLKGKTNDELLALPKMRDENKIAAMRILSSLWLACVVSERVFHLLLITFRMVQLSLRCGISDFSAVGFAVYGMILCGRISLKKGYRFGPLALELQESKGAKMWSPRVNLFAYCGVKHFRTPLHECPAPFVTAYNVAMSSGDIEFALLSALHYCMFYYFSGMPLHPIEKDMKAYCNQMREYKQDTSQIACAAYHQCVLNLMGLSDNIVTLTGEAMDQEEARTRAMESKNMQAVTVIMLLRMQLAYYFGETELAKKLLKESQSLSEPFKGTHWGVVQTYFEGLVSLSIARETKKSSRRRSSLRLARKSMKKVKSLVKCSACNCLHMFLLLKAEYASLAGSESDEDVRKAYDSAINAAGRVGFMQDKALSNELAGRFFLAKGDESRASFYLSRAHETYIQWGAQGKADQLRSDHFTLISADENVARRRSMLTSRSRPRFSSEAANIHRRLSHLEVQSVSGHSSRRDSFRRSSRWSSSSNSMQELEES